MAPLGAADRGPAGHHPPRQPVALPVGGVGGDALPPCRQGPLARLQPAAAVADPRPADARRGGGGVCRQPAAVARMAGEPGGGSGRSHRPPRPLPEHGPGCRHRRRIEARHRPPAGRLGAGDPRHEARDPHRQRDGILLGAGLTAGPRRAPRDGARRCCGRSAEDAPGGLHAPPRRQLGGGLDLDLLRSACRRLEAGGWRVACDPRADRGAPPGSAREPPRRHRSRRRQPRRPRHEGDPRAAGQGMGAFPRPGPAAAAGSGAGGREGERGARRRPIDHRDRAGRHRGGAREACHPGRCGSTGCRRREPKRLGAGERLGAGDDPRRHQPGRQRGLFYVRESADAADRARRRGSPGPGGARSRRQDSPRQAPHRGSRSRCAGGGGRNDAG